MSFLSYFYSRVVERYSTPYNKDIRIIEEQGKYKLLSGGARESGAYIEGLWQDAMTAFHILPSPDIRSILVLGVAGGTVIHLLHALFPDAAITGVDIDKTMIEIGKKYFNLSRVTNLTLVVCDANQFIQESAKAGVKWDMIIVDLYIAASIPPFVGEEPFWRTVKKLLTGKGAAIVNYSRWGEYVTLSQILLEKLKKIFPTVVDAPISYNRFFLVK